MTGIALIIPLRDEEASVGTLLESILAQTRRPDEVVVVESGSTDRTAEIVQSFSDRLPLRLLRREALFPGTARNVGVAATDQEWVAFTDGGIHLDPRWLESLVEARDKEKADVIFGAFEPLTPGWFEECAAIAYVQGRGRDGTRGASVASLLMRKQCALEVGGFPPYRAAEDLIFIEKVASGDRRIAHAPEARVHWQLPANVGQLFRRFASYSFHNLVAQRGRHWHRGVARLYLVLLALIAVTLALGGGRLALVLIPVFYLARAVRAAVAKHRSFGFNVWAPHRLIGAAGMLALIDLATLVGAVRFAGSGSGTKPR